MKILFSIFIFGLIVFLNLGLFLPSLLAVKEEDIGRNINHLKKYKWFQDLLNNQEHKQLIIHDKDVRRVIGTFDSKKMDKNFFQDRYRKKIQNIIQQKSNSLV